MEKQLVLLFFCGFMDRSSQARSIYLHILPQTLWYNCHHICTNFGFSLQVTSSVNGGNLSPQVNLGRHYSCIGYFGCQFHDVIFVLQMKMVVERSPLIRFHVLSLAHVSPLYRPWASEVILDN